MFKYILFFIPPLFWGLTTVVEKHHLLDIFKPVELLLVRGLYILLLMLLYTLYNKKIITKLKNINKKTFFYLSLATLVNVSALVVFWYVLSKYNTIYPTAIASSFWVVFAVLFATLIYKEKIKSLQIFGIILVTLGLFLINM